MLSAVASTSVRLLQLLDLLQRRRHWPGTELAERLGISPRSLRRDVDRLRGLGHPVESSPGVDGGYRLGEGASLPPLILDDREAIALAVGLHGLANQRAPELAEATASALAKLVGVLPAALRRRVELLAQVTESRGWRPPPADLDLEVVGGFAQACRDCVRVRFHYRARDGTASDRYAEPYRLVALTGRWYLVAFDLDREDWRTFRVDRATEVKPQRNAFTPRPMPSDDLAAFVEQQIRSIRPSVHVVLVVHGPPDDVRAAVGPHPHLEPVGTATRLTMVADSLDWPLALIAALDHDVEIIEPPELLDRVRVAAEQFARCYGT
jgi:predicted DNA-binding transcriptional regulator YafY